MTAVLYTMGANAENDKLSIREFKDLFDFYKNDLGGDIENLLSIPLPSYRELPESNSEKIDAYMVCAFRDMLWEVNLGQVVSASQPGDVLRFPFYEIEVVTVGDDEATIRIKYKGEQVTCGGNSEHTIDYVGEWFVSYLKSLNDCNIELPAIYNEIYEKRVLGKVVELCGIGRWDRCSSNYNIACESSDAKYNDWYYGEYCDPYTGREYYPRTPAS
jgi:hypothetical protein